MEALFASAPGWSTLATSVSVACAGESSAPTVQMPVAVSYEPCEGAAETNESPAGNASAIVTPVAGLGPRFVARTVNVSVSPTSASWRSTSLSTSRSAAGVAVVPAAAESLPTIGSGSFWPVLTARFVITPGAVTVAVRTSCAVSLTASDPTDHAPVAGSYAPWLADADTKSNPAGRLSVTSMPVAGFGPWLSAVIVTSISSPTSTLDEGTVFVTSTSASRFSVVTAVAVLFAVFVSNVVEDTSVTFSIGDGPL